MAQPMYWKTIIWAIISQNINTAGAYEVMERELNMLLVVCCLQ